MSTVPLTYPFATPFDAPFTRTRRVLPEDSALPSFRQIARRVVPQAVEASIIPAVIMFVLLNVAGGTVAILAALAWIVATASWRAVKRRSISGLTTLSIIRLTVRSVIAIALGSTFVYFIQGSIGGFALASAFLVSVAMARPLVRRFAEDVTDLPRHVIRQPRVHRVLRRLSLMWGVVGIAHAVTGLLLLLHLSTNAYVVVNAALSVAVPATLIAVSVVWFRRTVLSLPALEGAST